MNRPPSARILVWDAAVRVCHGGFAISMVMALWWGYGSDPESPAFLVHMLAGFLALWFLALCLVLACCGSRHARWRAFLHGPRAVGAHLRAVLGWRSTIHPGLNPMTMPFAATLHAVLIGLVVTGFAGAWAAAWHGQLAGASQVLIGCHLLGLILGAF